LPKETKTIEIRKAAVVGAGTMGGGIAMNYPTPEYPWLLKRNLTRVSRSRSGDLKKKLRELSEEGRFSQEVMDQRMGLITPTLNLRRF